jgi:hypothetical protein
VSVDARPLPCGVTRTLAGPARSVRLPRGSPAIVRYALGFDRAGPIFDFVEDQHQVEATSWTTSRMRAKDSRLST